MQSSTLQCPLTKQQPRIDQRFQDSNSQKYPHLSHKNISKTTDIQNIQLPRKDIDIERQTVSIKLPMLEKQDAIHKKNQSYRNDENTGLTNRVSEIKYPLFRTKSKKLHVILAEPTVLVSAQNKRFIQSFLQKLKMVETYALQNQEIADEYIQLIYQLNRKQGEYTEMITRRDKLSRTAEQQLALHSSAANQRLRAELAEDLRKIRTFAFKAQIPMHRKDIISQSLELTSSRSGILTPKSLKKSGKKIGLIPIRVDSLEKESDPPGDSGAESLEERKGMALGDMLLSLKLKRRQSLTQKQRNKLGASYLKKSFLKQTTKGSKQGERSKISLIKQVVHHWGIDNRFLRVSTEIDQLEPEDQRVQKNHSQIRHIKPQRDVNVVP